MTFLFFFSSRRRHTRWTGDWSSDVCSSDLVSVVGLFCAFVAWEARPPPHATNAQKRPATDTATRTRARTPMVSPSLGAGILYGLRGRRVVRRRAPDEPVAERVGLIGQTPFLKDRQRHGAHTALG